MPCLVWRDHSVTLLRRLLGGLLFALCACGYHGVRAHYLRTGDCQGDVPTLNPHLYSNGTVSEIAQLTQAYLTRYDAQNRPYPELLTTIPTQRNGGISADGRTIVWHLRRGARWSDGAPFTADDLIFSTRAVLNPSNNELGRDGFNLIDGMREPDKYTVVYHLQRPYAAYQSTFFSSANVSLLPEHLLARFPNINQVPYNSKPVGIGPFRIVQWKRADSVELERNPFYFRGRAKLDRITFKLLGSCDAFVTQLRTREVDLWPGASPLYIAQVANLPGLAIAIIRNGTEATLLGLNVTRAPLNDVRVRRAIRYAVDRRRIFTKIAHGYAALQDSPISAVLPFAPGGIPFIEHDPARAARLLDSAGWRTGPDGIRLKRGRRLTLQFAYSNGASPLNEMAQLIRDDLIKVGIDVETRTYPADRLFGSYDSGGILAHLNWDLTLYAVSMGVFGDISEFFGCDRTPPGGTNFGHYCNPALDGLFEKSKRIYDERRRAALLDREVRVVVRDVPLIVLYMNGSAIVSDKRVSGFKPGITGFDNALNLDI